MHHLDLRANEDRQKVFCPLQRTSVSRPGLRENPFSIGCVRVDGQAGRDAPEQLGGLLRRRMVCDDRVDDRCTWVVRSISNRLGIDDLVHEYVDALCVAYQILRDARIAR